uniref:Uncharacterized protein n=1 Tax=Glossina pallidipes TaxID=7398 RepID=A0A1B0ADP8_GLOPL
MKRSQRSHNLIDSKHPKTMLRTLQQDNLNLNAWLPQIIWKKLFLHRVSTVECELSELMLANSRSKSVLKSLRYRSTGRSKSKSKSKSKSTVDLYQDCGNVAIDRPQDHNGQVKIVLIKQHSIWHLFSPNYSLSSTCLLVSKDSNISCTVLIADPAVWWATLLLCDGLSVKHHNFKHKRSEEAICCNI